MNARLVRLVAVVFCLGFLPIPALGQCKNQQDRHCWNLQYMLYAAQTDFRELRGLKPTHLDASLGATEVPCHPDAWLNNVAMLLCSAELSPADAEQWYAKTMSDLRQLQYLWEFKIASSGEDHFVDAGPPDCEIAAMEGPYIKDGPYWGQCPLHLQTLRQSDGSSQVVLWITSYTSAFLEVNRRTVPGTAILSVSKSAAPAQPIAAPGPSASSASAAAPTLPSTPPSSVASSSAPASAANSSSTLSSPPSNAPAPSSVAPPAAESSVTGVANPATATALPREARAGCDELCQGLKKVLEERWSAFREVNGAPGVSAKNASSGLSSRASSNTYSSVASNTSSSTSSGTSSDAATVKLFGSSSCLINAVPLQSMQYSAGTPVPGGKLRAVSAKGAAAKGSRSTQYVCYWPEDSAAAAESQFRDLIALLQVLIPSSWSAQEQNETDELSGAQMTVWWAQDATNRPAVRLYLSGQSVGLHVAASE